MWVGESVDGFKNGLKNAFAQPFWNFGVKILITFLLISQLVCKTQGCR